MPHDHNQANKTLKNHMTLKNMYVKHLTKYYCLSKTNTETDKKHSTSWLTEVISGHVKLIYQSKTNHLNSPYWENAEENVYDHFKRGRKRIPSDISALTSSTKHYKQDPNHWNNARKRQFLNIERKGGRTIVITQR